MNRKCLLVCAIILGLAATGLGCSSGDEAERAESRKQTSPRAEGGVAASSTGAAGDTAPGDRQTEPSPEVTTAPETSPDVAGLTDAEPLPKPAAQPTPQPQDVRTGQPVPEPTSPQDTPPATAPAPSPQTTPQVPAPDVPASTPAPEGDLTGEVIAVAATKPGLSYVGAAKCKTCHKVQYASWETTAHAERTPPLDCEGCHGPGSEYKKLSIMKDPEQARAAGLVMPDKSFCTSTCHRDTWQDEMLAQSHAHKNDEP